MKLHELQESRAAAVAEMRSLADTVWAVDRSVFLEQTPNNALGLFREITAASVIQYLLYLVDGNPVLCRCGLNRRHLVATHFGHLALKCVRKGGHLIWRHADFARDGIEIGRNIIK
jgi:hypothetical protein